MSNKLIKLKLTTEKNCFLNVPRSWKEDIQHKVLMVIDCQSIQNNYLSLSFLLFV